VNWKARFVTLCVLVVLLAVITVWVLSTKTAQLEFAETKLAKADSLLVTELRDAHADRNCYTVVVYAERFRADKKRYPKNSKELAPLAKEMRLKNPYSEEFMPVIDAEPTEPGQVAYLPTKNAKGNITGYEVITVYYDGISLSVWFP
jgi:hypothetical protein